MTRLIVACALALALALPAAAAAAPSRSASGSQTYLDSTGELPDGPDIANVTVSNDDAGLLTFQVAIPNRPTRPSGLVVVLYLDTDQNLATGNTDLDGAEYAIAWDDSGATLVQWNGSGWNFDVPETTLVTGYGSGTATIRISRTELGNPAAFNFWVAAFEGDGATAPRDFAPDADHGVFSYALSIATPAKPTPSGTNKKSTKQKKSKSKKKHKTRRLAAHEVRVQADAGWTDTGLTVVAGQTVSVAWLFDNSGGYTVALG